MTVARILKGKVGKVITASLDDSIMSLAGRLSRHDIGALVVLDTAGAVAGMITEGDVLRAVASGQACDASVTAADIMRPCSLFSTPDTTEAELLDVMSDNHIHHLPVMNNGRLAGIVSLGDVVRLRRQKIRDMLAELETLAEDGRFTANLKRHRTTTTPRTLARAS